MSKHRHASARRLHLAAQAAAEAGLDFENPRLRNDLMEAHAALGPTMVTEVLVAYAAASNPSRRQVAALKELLGVVSSGSCRWDEVATTAATKR